MPFRTFVNSISIWPAWICSVSRSVVIISLLFIDKRHGNSNKSIANWVEPFNAKPQMLKYCTCWLSVKPQQKPKSFHAYWAGSRERRRRWKNEHSISWWNGFFYSILFPKVNRFSFHLLLNAQNAHLFLADYFEMLLQYESTNVCCSLFSLSPFFHFAFCVSRVTRSTNLISSTEKFYYFAIRQNNKEKSKNFEGEHGICLDLFCTHTHTRTHIFGAWSKQTHVDYFSPTSIAMGVMFFSCVCLCGFLIIRT